MLKKKNKRESQPEALKPNVDFSSLAMKFLDGIFFQYKAVSSTGWAKKPLQFFK